MADPIAAAAASPLRTRRPHHGSRLLALALALVLSGCMADDGMQPNGAMTPGNGMGMGLGGSAEVAVLAQGELEHLLAGPLRWVAYEVREREPRTHVHGAGFVYATGETHLLAVNGEEVSLEPGEAHFLPHGTRHTHRAGAYWDIELEAIPAEEPSPTTQPGTLVFVGEALEGVPAPPVSVSFVHVVLPANGGATAVHTHPGPEFIYVTRGTFEYETGLSGTEQLAEGNERALAADIAVQKRNPGMTGAAFLSLFVLDPERPFSSEADFE